MDLCFTSPPYMSAFGHPENPLTGYTTLDGVYSKYLDQLEDVFRQVANLLRPSGYAVINVADTGPGGRTPLVADVEARVSKHLWLQQRLPVVWDDRRRPAPTTPAWSSGRSEPLTECGYVPTCALMLHLRNNRALARRPTTPTTTTWSSGVATRSSCSRTRAAESRLGRRPADEAG